jgi:hypothetical protein
MAAKFICDGCGKEAPATYGVTGQAFHPPSWFQRSDDDGPQHACCRKCIDKIAAETGKTRVILPV